jgi:hypothetical protein
MMARRCPSPHHPLALSGQHSHRNLAIVSLDMSGSECGYLETLGYVHLSSCLIVDLVQLRCLFRFGYTTASCLAAYGSFTLTLKKMV